MSAVRRDRNAPSAYRIVIAHIVLHPAFNTTLLVIVGADALFVEITSDLAAVNEEVADIIPRFLKVFDQLRKACHILTAFSILYQKSRPDARAERVRRKIYMIFMPQCGMIEA